MSFVVYRSSDDPAVFLVTDPAHEGILSTDPDVGEVQKVGDFAELGARRAAFDERLARSAIAHKGYYRFEPASFAAVPGAPEPPI